MNAAVTIQSPGDLVLGDSAELVDRRQQLLSAQLVTLILYKHLQRVIQYLLVWVM